MYFTTTESLIQETKGIIIKVKSTFGHLSDNQLNWKSNAEKWSVGQCIDHLNKSIIAYNLPFMNILKGDYKKSGMQRIGFLNRFWGKQLLKVLDPANRKPSKTFTVFEPIQSDIPIEVIEEFENNYEFFIGTLRDFSRLDLDKIIISSPVTTMINFPLLDALNIIVVHCHRHILQAEEVMNMEGFPTE